MKRQAGFTLLEVLVALVIFAAVAASVLTASQRSLQIAGQLERKALAGWIADNRISEMQLLTPTPAETRDEQNLDYAGRKWELLSEVEPTSDKDLRRVTVWVALKPERGGAVSIKERAEVVLVGFLVVRR